MRAYHFVPADHGIENIKLRHLKIARLDDLNDPFEVRTVINVVTHMGWQFPGSSGPGKPIWPE